MYLDILQYKLKKCKCKLLKSATYKKLIFKVVFLFRKAED